MSLITRCPACATMFKVVPDQLRISAGWVRCGVCGEVFDAAENVLERENDELPPATPRPLPPDSEPEELEGQPEGDPNAPNDVSIQVARAHEASEKEATAPVPELTEQDVIAPDVAPDHEQPLLSAEDALAPPEIATSTAVTGSLPVVALALPDAPPRADALFARMANLNESDSPLDVAEQSEEPYVRRDRAGESAHNPGPPEVADSERARVSEAQSEAWLDEIAETAYAKDEPLEPLLPREEVPSFVKQAERRAFWGSRGMRITVWLVALAAAVLLAAQWAVSERDWLAAREPRLTSVLEALCRPSGCKVGPFQDLKSIVIDGSSFQRTSADSFQLSFGLRNDGDIPVATPSLELTLTDAQNQTLQRLVLSVKDITAPPTLAAHAEFNGAKAINAKVSDPMSIVGYRLVAFYP